MIMSDIWNSGSAWNGEDPAQSDALRKLEIEHLMMTDRPRYFRDEDMQQEYRNILDRQAGRQPAAQSDTAPDAAPKPPRMDWDSSQKDNGLPNWSKSYFVDTPDEQRPGALLDFHRNEHENNIDRLPVANTIAWAAGDAGHNARTMKIIADLESSGKPGPNPKKKVEEHKGLFQLTDKLFEKYGRAGGNIYNAKDNTEAAMRSISANIKEFKDTKNNGRDPTQAEIYMAHQQGVGGVTRHLKNPDRLAWQNMRFTGEGRQRAIDYGAEAADKWARTAIWNNLTPDEREKAGNVDSITSGQFLDFWKRRFEGRR
jgi:hypothetical protein